MISESHHKISGNDGSSNDQLFDIFSEARESAGLDIRYATITDGFPLEYDRNANLFEFWEYLLYKFPSHVDEFIGNLIQSPLSSEPMLVPFLIADTFAPWSGFIAKKYNLVNVSFWTQPATVFAINYHMNLLSENGHFPLAGIPNKIRLFIYNFIYELSNIVLFAYFICQKSVPLILTRQSGFLDKLHPWS